MVNEGDAIADRPSRPPSEGPTDPVERARWRELVTPDQPDTSEHRQLSDRQLHERMDADLRTVREVRRKGISKVTGAELDAGIAAAQSAKAGRAELHRRMNERETRGWMARIGRRGHPLSVAREREAPLLDGLPLDHRKLSDEELKELRQLLRDRGPSDEERPRYEALVGKAAGEVGIIARIRDEREREAAMRAEAEKLARAFLPRRRDPEPGSIELPRFLYGWVTDRRDDTFDVADLGVLAAILFAFANEDAALFARGEFVLDGGDPRIVISDAGQGVRLCAGASDGQLQTRQCIERLRVNRWLEVERQGRGSTMILRPGERMRKLWQ